MDNHGRADNQPTTVPNAAQVHAEAIVVDGCSFFFEGYNDQLREAGVTAINFTVPLPMDDYAQALIRIKEYYDEVSRDPNSRIIYGTDDIRTCKDNGQFGVIIGCQNSRLIGTDIGLLRVFSRLGLKTLQLTYNERNFVGDGCLEPNDAGLSHFGRRVVQEAGALGMAIDLSHASVKTSLETIRMSKAPCVISHGGVGAFVPGPRSIGDEVMVALAESGGVMGITTHPNMNWRGGARRPSLEDFLEAVDYAVDRMGIDHVGIGTDYVARPKGYPQWVKDYLRDTYAPYRAAEDQEMTVTSVMGGLDPREDQLEGFMGMQHLPRVTSSLLDRGYTAVEAKKVLGGNFMRVFDKAWTAA